MIIKHGEMPCFNVKHGDIHWFFCKAWWNTYKIIVKHGEIPKLILEYDEIPTLIEDHGEIPRLCALMSILKFHL